MATLGNQTVGFTFTVNTWGDMAGGAYTVPSPGIIVQNINAFAGNNGTAQNARLYVWQASGGIPGAWLIRGSALFSLGALGWQQQSALAPGAGVSSDLYLPAGTVIWVGIYCAGNTEQVQANSGSGGGTEIGNTSDGNWSDHGVAGLGQMGAYITYTPLAAPTLSSATPAVAPAGATTTLVGTGLLHTSSITVCGVNAPTFTITDDSHITVTVPAGAAGAGNIVVTTPAGTASIAFVAGQIYYGTGAAVASIKAVWYGDPSGSGVPHTAAGVWVPNGAGVKRVW